MKNRSSLEATKKRRGSHLLEAPIMDEDVATSRALNDI
jgi:hypothetical protein